MVNETGEIKVFLESKNYTEIAKRIIDLAGKRLCTDLYDAEVEFSRRSLNDAELSLLDIERLLEHDCLSIEKFSLELIRSENKLRVDQEFNPLDYEEVDDSQESYAGHSPTFLLTSSILFLLLRDRKSYLSVYLKKSRQPNAKKYQRALEEVFESVQ
ncbi:hypothetical protein [Pseudomonas sp. S1Bt23]|uniref:hypothetical protein n=1 Tax=Pseudomonas sp. S1Bt23 TaxID=3095074 RepID=UPI002A5AF4B8|nr:hypothetical protein [Pseudomonas sp. S1Bt23]WPO50161.1 hypothetical protein SHB59_14295 [Pseudomonas sp. S1Bt23]